MKTSAQLYAISAAIILADQLTKAWVRTHMYIGQSIGLLGDWLKLTYTENEGMAFGVNLGFKPVLTLFSLAATVALVYAIYRMRRAPLLTRVPLAMILGGAAGNLIDRFFYGVLFQHMPLLEGRVVDFIHVDWPGSIFGWESFPIFNLADSAIVVGVGFILLFNGRIFPAPETSAAPESTKAQ